MFIKILLLVKCFVNAFCMTHYEVEHQTFLFKIEVDKNDLTGQNRLSKFIIMGSHHITTNKEHNIDNCTIFK